uniref:Protein kinase domain-containing protein n=1 Tax=Prymnesium polylepis TaxID=72548 RepID=A0A6T8AW03_9EUKA|mmetsp:Transcript_6043/g.15823  ORF Transcript_6043/g.15823 Transcript_6043/m.15823 type:complete len:350 (-) Transcript_6043:670-1719(-)
MSLEEVNVDVQGTKARLRALADADVTNIAEVYSMGEELGRGRFSVVRQATHLKENVGYAVKEVENESLDDEENLEALETEIKILRKLRHPHIVNLKEVVLTGSYTYIIMELLSGGELFHRIIEKGCFPEVEAQNLFAQILMSMEYLHSLQIVHRDVKPENILYVSEGSVDIKLIDFGYAGIWSADKPLTGLCGTPDYVAPEVLSWYDDDDTGTPYGKGSDLWSLGVLLYVILSGCSPFNGEEEEQLLKLVAEAKYEFYEKEWEHISAEAKELISKLLVVDPNERYTMEQVVAHPWLTDAVAKARAQVKAAQEAQPAVSKVPPPSSAPPIADTLVQRDEKQANCSSCAIL